MTTRKSIYSVQEGIDNINKAKQSCSKASLVQWLRVPGGTICDTWMMTTTFYSNQINNIQLGWIETKSVYLITNVNKQISI